MKKIIYWLMGEKAGCTIVGGWNWLWGIPVESGGKVAVDVAEASLRSMQASVQNLTQAVAAQVAAYQRAKQKYEFKVKEMQRAERQATLAQRNGNTEAARLAMAGVLRHEKFLPQLEGQVRQAEQFVNQSKERLNRERMQLESLKSELQNIKDMAEINDALRAVAETNRAFSIDSARSQFEDAKSAVERRSLREHAYAELSENPAEKLTSDLAQMTLDDEVSRRLQQLEQVGPMDLPSSMKPLNQGLD